MTQIWAITQNIEECNEIADNTREALTQLKEYEVISDELLVNVTWLYDNTTEVINFLINSIFLLLDSKILNKNNSYLINSRRI